MSLGNLGVSKFEIDIISRADMEHANYTNENVLIKTNPDVPYWENIGENVLDYVASASPSIYGEGNKDGGFFKAITNGSGVRWVSGQTLRWKMRGVGKNKIYIDENLMVGVLQPGIGHSDIRVKFNKQRWQSSDTIYVEKDPTIRFSVQGKPVADGTGYIYTLQLHTRYDDAFLNPEYLAEGTIFCKAGASVSEGSGEYGSTYTNAGSILQYESHLNSWSKMHEITDDGYKYAVRLKAVRKSGNKESYMKNIPELTMGLPEAEFLVQERYERELDAFWGQYAGRNILDPSTGVHRKIGEGAIEFYQDGNVTPYHRNRFSIDFLRNIFRRHLYNKVKPSNAVIRFKAGIGLMELVDDAITREYERKAIERPVADYVRKGPGFPGSSTSGKHLTDIMFTGFDLKPYGTVIFEHLPLLDDIDMHGGRLDPKTGYPETSFWGLVDSIGMGKGNNLELLRRKNSEFFNYVCGMLSPVGFINRKTGTTGYHSAHSKRSYTMHAGIEEGVRMIDTKNSMFLHPAWF